MKKFFALILMLCLMTSALCVVSSATDPVVIRVCGMKEDETLILPESYTTFSEGWNRAVKLAKNHDWMDENGIDRIVVDLYSDWTGGKMGSGEGFSHSTIYVPDETRMMINMNGHTINRNLSEDEHDGEVICIGTKADIIINGGQYKNVIVGAGEDPGYTKMGTIRGGYSDNGAGGIHMDGEGLLILNNVHLIDNGVKGDDGAAIAAYNGSTVIMNGGSISNNSLEIYIWSLLGIDINFDPYGGLFLKNSSATLNNVTLDGNHTFEGSAQGVVIYATENSTVTMDKCVVSNNAINGGGLRYARSVIAAYNSKLIITDTNFIGNASYEPYSDTHLFYLENSSMSIKGGRFTQNNPKELFRFKNSSAELNGVTITENTAKITYVDNDSQKVTMTACTLGSNTPNGDEAEISVKNSDLLEMIDCTIGDTTFDNLSNIKFTTTDGRNEYKPAGTSSIFGEGSLNMIISLLALVASIASIAISFTLYKKLAPTTASNAKADNEE